MSYKNLVQWVLAVTIFCYAWSTTAGTNDNSFTGNATIYSKLNLSEKQLERIRQVRADQRQTVKEKENQANEARLAFRAALRNNASEDELKKLFISLQTARSDLYEARFQQMMKMRGVLSDEQQQKFHEIRASRGGGTEY